MLSLKELCLSVIVRKFEQFYFAYTVSNDYNIQRNINFLQRRFSHEVLHKLHQSRDLKEEFLELLINEYLNYLFDQWIRDCASEYSWNDLFLRLPNLKEIEFWSCNDEILEYLAKYCPKLVKIDFSRWCNVTDKGVENLCKGKNGMVPLPELKNIFIKLTNITDRGVECLIRNLPSLQRIDCKNVPLLIHSMHEENLHKFNRVQTYNLVELSFLRSDGLSKSKSLPNHKDILKTCLPLCPKLESLSCYISDKEQLDLITNIPWKKLHLEFSTTGVIFNIDYFLKLKRYSLTTLKITDCTLSISALALHSPYLHDFSAERVSFSDVVNDDDLKVTFSYLWFCEFKDVEPSSNKGICVLLSSSPELGSLTLNNCMLSLELRKQILLWGKRAWNIDLYGIDVTLEMEFLEDILLNSPYLSSMCLSDESLHKYELEELGISQKLHNLANSLPNKPEVWFSTP